VFPMKRLHHGFLSIRKTAQSVIAVAEHMRTT
jgi:hypothetical protein